MDEVTSSLYELSNLVVWFLESALAYFRKILKLSELKTVREIWVGFCWMWNQKETEVYLFVFRLINRRHMDQQFGRLATWQPLVLHCTTRWRSCCWLRTLIIHFCHTSFELSVSSGNDSMLYCIGWFAVCVLYLFPSNRRRPRNGAVLTDQRIRGTVIILCSLLYCVPPITILVSLYISAAFNTTSSSAMLKTSLALMVALPAECAQTYLTGGIQCMNLASIHLPLHSAS